MLFNKGNYTHTNGFGIMVDEDGSVMLTPNHPQSMRLADFFDSSKWVENIPTDSTTNEEEE